MYVFLQVKKFKYKIHQKATNYIKMFTNTKPSSLLFNQDLSMYFSYLNILQVIK